MTERPKPYIGVSGVVGVEQQRTIEEQFIQQGLPDRGRRLFHGIKAVHKTQYLDIENKYGPEWYPVGENSFRNNCSPSLDTNEVACIAQVYLDPEYIEDADYRTEFVQRILKRGQYLNGLQFDMLPWDSNDSMQRFLEDIKSARPDIMVLLQCHGNAMKLLGPKGATKKLGAYANVLDYVLFDSSEGRGIRMSPESLEPFIYEAYSSSCLGRIGLAIAGGLDEPAVREFMPPIVGNYPDISWDAEGRLHPVNTADKRPLNIKLVNEYFASSSKVLQ